MNGLICRPHLVTQEARRRSGSEADGNRKTIKNNREILFLTRLKNHELYTKESRRDMMPPGQKSPRPGGESLEKLEGMLDGTFSVGNEVTIAHRF